MEIFTNIVCEILEMIHEDPDDPNSSFFEQELLPEINTTEDVLGLLQWDEGTVTHGNNLI